MGTEQSETADAGRVADQDQSRDAMAPGDEAPPGDPSAGENLCRTCNGSGEADGKECETCGGTGKVASAVSGGA